MRVEAGDKENLAVGLDRRWHVTGEQAVVLVVGSEIGTIAWSGGPCSFAGRRGRSGIKCCISRRANKEYLPSWQEKGRAHLMEIWERRIISTPKIKGGMAG